MWGTKDFQDYIDYEDYDSKPYTIDGTKGTSKSLTAFLGKSWFCMHARQGFIILRKFLKIKEIWDLMLFLGDLLPDIFWSLE